MKILLFVSTNFRCFYKMHWSTGSWIRGVKCYRKQSMGKLYFVEFQFSWFKWNMKSTKIRTPRLLMISQYDNVRKEFKLVGGLQSWGMFVGHRCLDHMVVGFTTTCAISDYLHEKLWVWITFMARCTRYNIYVIKFVKDMQQVCGFLQVLRFPPPIKLTATI